MDRRVWLIVGLLTVAGNATAEPLRVVSYNVENLFHPERDSLIDDAEWTPDGEKRWSMKRYNRKVENIARVLTDIGEWSGVDAVGLQEVECAAVVKELSHTLRPGEYDFVHYDSPDRRGIDVAFVYKKAQIDTISSDKIAVDLGAETTRDILYVCARRKMNGDTIHFFVCHLPSQRGGAAESEWKRIAAKRALQTAVDSVLAADRQAKIVVMGDMNSTPREDMNGLHNRMIAFQKKGTGTHKHHGRWTCLDQFYLSPALDAGATVSIYNAEWIQETDEKYTGLTPKRTYSGFVYTNGYSDHLPVVLDIP